MRFFANGPNIPDLLLEERDKGRVVFLCGAGVSVGAGLPNFPELTGQVIEFFDPSETSPLAETYEYNEDGNFEGKVPLDQIFQLLYQEFGRAEVQGVVAHILGQTPDHDCNAHHVIARLSADQAGKPQIVTTNFDRLFEDTPSLNDYPLHTPPAFPDISLGIPMHGITYLHGRLQSEDEGAHSYVLSSSDFGRAYLSEAWATRFVRSLLDSYTVVLVGYQAEDPPIKYLLQGLNHDGLFDRSRLYAFDRGSQDEVDEKWFDRGVTAIAFDEFQDLWQSLEAWAKRAEDPRKWRAEAVEMAMKGPRGLSVYQRGQVAHLVRSAAGARLFARADPSPPAEWLCVFDCRYRLSKAQKNFDPAESYGLDDDPVEHASIDWNKSDILDWRPGDSFSKSVQSLGQRQPPVFTELPPRLLNLSRWIAEKVNSPVCLWWSVQQKKMHPRLLEELKQSVRRTEDLHVEARKFWELFFKSMADERTQIWDRSCFDLQDTIRQEGWSSNSLRLFHNVVAPIIKCAGPFAINSPPLSAWDEADPLTIAKWEVNFPEWHGEVIDVPDDALVDALEILEGSLRIAEDLFSQTNTVFFTKPTCYPSRDAAAAPRDEDRTFYWYLELFDRLIRLRPGNAVARVVLWKTEAPYYFRRLKVYSMNQPELFSASESLTIFRGLIASGEIWDMDIRREVLFFLNDRWEEFSPQERSEVVQNLMQDPHCAEDQAGEGASSQKSDLGLRYLQWLLNQGKKLSDSDIQSFKSTIDAIPNWSEHSVERLTEHDGLLVTSIDVNENPEVLNDLPINLIVEKSEEAQTTDWFSGTDSRPFDGLVKENPRKALLSLSLAARSERYPKKLWAALLNSWPEASPKRSIDVLLERLARLPPSFLSEVKTPVSQWLERWFNHAFIRSNERAWRVFDSLMPGLVDKEEDQQQSDGPNDEDEIRNRSTYGHAINHPVGHLAQALLHVIRSKEFLEADKPRDEFRTRFERLLDAPGRCGQVAASILARHISFLYLIEADWVDEHLLPRFEFEHPHCFATWNGFLSSAQIPPKLLMRAMKPRFLELFGYIEHWGWEDDVGRISAQMVVELVVSDMLSAKEARRCIRRMTNRNRKDAVDYLKRIGLRAEGAWSEKVIPFIDNVWPREVKLKTPSLTTSWVSLLERTGDSFLPVLDAVRKFLVSVERESHWLYSLSRAARADAPVTMRYPEGVLELLYLLFSRQRGAAPYELAQVLDLIVESKSTLAGDYRYISLQSWVERS